MKKYPLDLEQCFEACRKDYEKSGKEFDAVSQDFIKVTVEFINDAYYCGLLDGANAMKGGVTA